MEARARELLTAELAKSNRTFGACDIRDETAVHAMLQFANERADAVREECAKVAANWCITKEAEGAKDTAFASARIATAIRQCDR